MQPMTEVPVDPDPRTAGVDSRLAMRLAAAAVLAVGLLLMLREVGRPFVGWHDWNSAIYSVFARNHIHYGLAYTKGFCTWGDTVLPPAEPQRYLNHPPLIAIWAAIPMWIFGDHEWVARLVPIASTLGAALVLMVMLSRLHSRRLGLLAGLFYVMLPLTAYFGRMLDHLAPVQLLSLLMLHGYLQWTGRYGPQHAARRGRAFYALGAVLGIGTGWAAVLMAGLIWLWHTGELVIATRAPGAPRATRAPGAPWATRAPRSIRAPRPRSDAGARRGSRNVLIGLTAIPALSVAAVVLHILWGAHGSISLLDLFWSRAYGPQALPMPWLEWTTRNARFLIRNVSLFGVLAMGLYLLLIPYVLKRTGPGTELRRVVSSGGAVVPILLLGLQGAMFVVLFKNQSGVHDSWQYLLGPFAAVAMAAVVLAAHAIAGSRWPRAALWLASAMVVVPIPSFASSLNWFYEQRQMPMELVDTFRTLSLAVPARTPVMTSRRFPEYEETFGGYTNRWPVPNYAYYANRPLFQTTDFDEIVANAPRGADGSRCGAYLLSVTNEPFVAPLAERLAERFAYVKVQEHDVIFLLDRPR